MRATGATKFNAKLYNNVHQTLSMLLHYLGTLKSKFGEKIHCALKVSFILLALTRWNLNRSSQFFHCWSHSEHLFICKEDEVRGKLGKLLQKLEVAYEQYLQCASVSSWAHRLLKHFSCRYICMMQTTVTWECLSSMIFHGLCCEFGAGPLDSEPYRSSHCFHPCGHFAVCRSPDVCPLCPYFWTSWATC